MKDKAAIGRGGVGRIILFILLSACVLPPINARALTVDVVDPDGIGITGGFRWLLEEDTTNVTDPGVPVRVSISTDIHNSYAPVVANGDSGGASTVNITNDANGELLDTSNRYFVSILPYAGFSNSGTVVEAGQESVTVTVNPLPLPTAQISLLAFVDHNPINNIYDAQEEGLGGATILLADSAGQVMQDAFGNPIGTQYAFDPGTGQAILDAEGNPTVIQMGTGVVTTLTQEQFDAGGSANPYNLQVGEALIKYLVPGKYGLQVIPPAFDDDGISMKWSQTSTIEGTPTVDAWVKANEPRFFTEGFGTGFNHVFYGFVKVSPAISTFKGQTLETPEWNRNPPASTGSITGTLRTNHFSRPPELQGFFPGPPVANGWVGLNDTLVQPGVGVAEAGKYAAPCNEDGSFTIENVPPGTYQLVTWDRFLDNLFGIYTVTVPPGASGTGEAVNIGNVLNFCWFGTLNNYVFYDENEDGQRQAGEAGIPEQNVNIRFRDGTIYQSFPTDIDGFVPFDEVFPFFKWLVVEVDFARFKATGMTTAVDYGGPIPGPSWPANGNKNPQPQDPNDPFNVYGDLDSRTETGPVLTQAMHLFLGQTNLIEWGKSSYAMGENGGISGIVFYAVTRAENDPRYAAAEPWEPGVPRVQVSLYKDMVDNATLNAGNDGIIDDLDTDGIVTLADVDNYPFNWAPMYEFLDDGVTPNPDYNPITPGPEDVDRNYPGQAPGEFDAGDAIQIVTTDSWDDSKPSGCIQDLPQLPGLGAINECADGFGTWNQVRPGIFDGGYAFDSYFPGGMTLGGPETDGLPSGVYIVEASTPPGYELLKEEDKNVDFGDTYVPSPLLLPAECVGDPHQVPMYLSQFPDQQIQSPFVWVNDVYVGNNPANFRPLCDRKEVSLTTGQNAAADFFLFTQVPKAARAVGFVNNDLAAEFNQASPIYGEKLAASWIPMSFRDWQGKELVRVYTDEFGGYNAMLPSTYTVNVPSPTGVSPSMITVVLNDPYLPNGDPDPFYDPDYAITPWTLNYMPGATSYLDTPIIPVSAFTANDVRLDTGPPDNTPVIYSVATDSQPGPLVCTESPGTMTVSVSAPPGGTVTIRNPLYPNLSTDPTITRDVGFGSAQGTGTLTLDGVELTVTSWGNEQIVATVPGGSDSGRLMVTRDNGNVSEVGVTLNVVNCNGGTTVQTVPGEWATIQEAIDNASAGDIILVGTAQFNENVVMDIPVRLQGSGQGSFINANPITSDRLQAWHERVEALAGQEFIDAGLNNSFTSGEAPGVFVVGATDFGGGQTLNITNPFSVLGQAAIDGFTISGSVAGGGIQAFSGAYGLEITNNNITNNQGTFAGGIAIGPGDLGLDPDNDSVVIRWNKIHRNGGSQGGGGIALNPGSDNYLVADNLIIGNFGRFNGGGIQHSGLSGGDNIIRNNRIIFNEIFYGAIQATAGDGAGIFIGGDTAGGTGSGNVTIDSNLIQGNMTGSGNGAGIRAFAVNGLDVSTFPETPENWYQLNIFNNMIVNNVAGNAGAGISLQDVARANIINNTIARNDSTATSSLAFQAGQPNSTPQPAGIASNLHSTNLQGFLPDGEAEFSDPVLVNNIIWQNRSYYNDATLNNGAGGLAVNPAGQYWDIHVAGSTTTADPHLDPDYCIITSLSNPATGFDYTTQGGGDATNNQGPPGLIGPYFNDIESTTIVDEGGNAINIRFTPLTLEGSDYHIGTGQAWNSGTDAQIGTFAELATDFDGETRPSGANSDIGADEIQDAVPVAPVIGSAHGSEPDFGSITTMPAGSVVAGIPGSPFLDVSNGGAGSLVNRLTEKVADFLADLRPGNSRSGGSGIIPASPVSGGNQGEAPGITQPVLRENARPAGSGSPISFGGNDRRPAGAENASVTEETPLIADASPLVADAPADSFSGNRHRSFLSPASREVSLSEYGMEQAVVSAATEDAPVQEVQNRRRETDSGISINRYTMVGLVLIVLALAFIIVVVPKTRKIGNK